MAFKYFVACASILLVKSALGQYVAPGSTVTGNSVVNNDIYVNNPSQLASLGSNLAGLATSGLASSSFGSGLGGSSFASGLASANFGSGLASGLASSSFGSGLAGSSLGTGFAGLGSGLASASGLGSTVVASSPLTVTSISPIGPSGLAVASENVLEGILTVNGQLPFLSAVAFEGPLPTSGSGVATCGCGSGNVGIVSEGLPNAGLGRGLY